MKAICFLATLLIFSASGFAQHPLVGTWEMISGKGINAEGEKFSFDTTSVREIKIITPTHYMLIACDVSGDSISFNRTMAGTVRLEGDRYFEDPMHASVEIFPNLKVDFKWRLSGGKFIQSGTVVRPDGKTIVLEELVFRKVHSAKPQSKNPAIGTWNQISAFHTRASDGKRKSDFNPMDTRFLIVTPTHWMRMDLKNKKFESARYGTYSIESDRIQTSMEYASVPFKKGDKQTFTQKTQGDLMHTEYEGQTTEGKDVYESTFKKIN